MSRLELLAEPTVRMQTNAADGLMITLKELDGCRSDADIQRLASKIESAVANSVGGNVVSSIQRAELALRNDGQTVKAKRMAEIGKLIENLTHEKPKRQRKTLRKILRLCAKNVGITIGKRSLCCGSNSLLCNAAVITGSVLVLAGATTVVAMAAAGHFEDPADALGVENEPTPEETVNETPDDGEFAASNVKDVKEGKLKRQLDDAWSVLGMKAGKTRGKSVDDLKVLLDQLNAIIEHNAPNEAGQHDMTAAGHFEDPADALGVENEPTPEETVDGTPDDGEFAASKKKLKTLKKLRGVYKELGKTFVNSEMRENSFRKLNTLLDGAKNDLKLVKTKVLDGIADWEAKYDVDNYNVSSFGEEIPWLKKGQVKNWIKFNIEDANRGKRTLGSLRKISDMMDECLVKKTPEGVSKLSNDVLLKEFMDISDGDNKVMTDYETAILNEWVSRLSYDDLEEILFDIDMDNMTAYETAILVEYFSRLPSDVLLEKFMDIDVEYMNTYDDDDMIISMAIRNAVDKQMKNGNEIIRTGFMKEFYEAFPDDNVMFKRIRLRELADSLTWHDKIFLDGVTRIQEDGDWKTFFGRHSDYSDQDKLRLDRLLKNMEKLEA